MAAASKGSGNDGSSAVALHIDAHANARVKQLFSSAPPARNTVRRRKQNATAVVVFVFTFVTRLQVAKRIQELALEVNCEFDDVSLHEQVKLGRGEALGGLSRGFALYFDR
jgi:hypothetical protein